MNIRIPPTVMLGFNQHDRFVYNCPRKRGFIVVKTISYPTPEDIRAFIKEHMSNYHLMGFDPNDVRTAKNTS